MSHNANSPAGALVTNQRLFKDGKPATLNMINQTLHPVGVQALTPTLFQPGPSTRPTSTTPFSTSSSTATHK